MSAGDCAKSLFVGVGNPHAGDDAVGRLVADILAQKNITGLVVKQSLGEASELIDLFEGYQTVYCCDAVRCRKNAGQILFFEAHKKPLPVTLFSLTTHDFGLPQAIELARNIGSLPDKLIVYGITAENFQPSAKLSTPLKKATRTVVDHIQSICHLQTKQIPPEHLENFPNVRKI